LLVVVVCWPSGATTESLEFYVNDVASFDRKERTANDMVRETRYLWVANLPDSVSEDQIAEYFGRQGTVCLFA